MDKLPAFCDVKQFRKGKFSRSLNSAGWLHRGRRDANDSPEGGAIA
jgi:hypothetical protein